MESETIGQTGKARGLLRIIGERLWLALAILTIILWWYPIEFGITRALFAGGMVSTWSGAVILWWPRKAIRWIGIGLGLLVALFLCLPGREVKAETLAAEYVQSLRSYEGVRYVWGGEGRRGIDCSGLVRKGMIRAQFQLGARTFNGRLIRSALSLWWHDTSALALRDGYRGWTAKLFDAESIADTDPSRLRAGDFAVTADGVHALAYLGNQEWIEADPGMRKVIRLTRSSESGWLRNPVVFLRWTWLQTP